MKLFTKLLAVSLLTACFGSADILLGGAGRAVCRRDFYLIVNLQLLENSSRRLHGIEIRF